jgi:hypothetical protein
MFHQPQPCRFQNRQGFRFLYRGSTKLNGGSQLHQQCRTALPASFRKIHASHKILEAGI